MLMILQLWVIQALLIISFPALGKHFTIGADEDLHHFLSMKITHNVPNRHIFLHQLYYINELCKRFLNGKHTTVSTPTDTNFKDLHHRRPEEAPSLGPYNQLIDSLLWLSQCTLSASVSACYYDRANLTKVT
jgi:hypothetical protein